MRIFKQRFQRSVEGISVNLQHIPIAFEVLGVLSRWLVLLTYEKLCSGDSSPWRLPSSFKGDGYMSCVLRKRACCCCSEVSGVCSSEQSEASLMSITAWKRSAAGINPPRFPPEIWTCLQLSEWKIKLERNFMNFIIGVDDFGEVIKEKFNVTIQHLQE